MDFRKQENTVFTIKSFKVLKNKKFAYFLFPLVLLLWVFIMYKVFFNSSSDGKFVLDNDISANQRISKKQSIQNYNLKFQNTNPFAMVSKSIEKNEILNSSKTYKPRKIQMEYLGYTKKGRSKLANILYRSKYYIVKERDSIGKYLLIEIQEDSVLVKSKSGSINTIKKKQL